MTMLFRASSRHPFRLTSIAAMVFAAHCAASAQAAPAQAATLAGQAEPDRSSAYYHYGLAHLYEEMAVNAGRPDYATQAVEEYKLALNADPNSTELQDGLADLYFKIGRRKDAVTVAQEQVKKNPDDLQAHLLLGKVYLNTLSDTQGTQASEALQLAITEYEAIARLQPKDVETKLLLGQLYGLNHQPERAEAEFKDAQKIDANSEEVVLNMARLYGEQGEGQRAADILASIPESDRTARIEFALGASYDMLKKPKEAAAAYRRSLDLEPDNPDAQRGLANALLLDDQLTDALKIFNDLVAADPQDSQSQIHISEIQRRQGNYDEALATLQKAKAKAPDSLELNYNEALIYDALGKFDQAEQVLTSTLAVTAHPEGKYSEQEKGYRSSFLDRLGTLYREENKTTEAVAAYKEIASYGGDYAVRGYQGEVDAYRDAHMWKEATAVAAEAAAALPKNHGVQLMYAGQLADMGKVDEALALAKAQVSSTPDDRDVDTALAQIDIRLKRFKDAGEQLDKAEALGVKQSQEITVAPLKDGAPAKDGAAATKSADAAPSDPKELVVPAKPEDNLYIYFLRGELYDREKLYAQAEEQFRKALAVNPENAAVLNYLGYMLADQGQKLPEALQMIRKAVEIDPQNGAYLDSLGWAYFKTGQYAQAEDNLRKANERGMNTDPVVHDHLGEVYEKTGKLKLAVAQWERSMTEYAHSLPADADPTEVQKVQRKLENARVKLAKLNTSEKDTK
jgi:tetratricopeptide (TPR) repeat protein